MDGDSCRYQVGASVAPVFPLSIDSRESNPDSLSEGRLRRQPCFLTPLAFVSSLFTSFTTSRGPPDVVVQVGMMSTKAFLGWGQLPKSSGCASDLRGVRSSVAPAFPLSIDSRESNPDSLFFDTSCVELWLERGLGASPGVGCHNHPIDGQRLAKSTLRPLANHYEQ